ncbi:MAG: hypothetical protein JWQ71_3446 [Pedosphaera sp.]|nr:hypothetical protein [Pedosphaera sp.]
MNFFVRLRQIYFRLLSFIIFSRTSAWRFKPPVDFICHQGFCMAWGLLLALTAGAAERPPLIDPVSAIKQFRIPPGFKIDLFASEPQLLNPVAFCFDEQGRIYVAETYRYRKSVYDIRSHMEMYSDDLACRTVDDRSAVIKKYLGDKFQTLTNESEQIRLIEDRDGDGRADFSCVFADGFNSILDGLGAGVLARKGNIYFTDIPNLWRLSDTNHSGHANVRTSLSYGYGVHFGLTGHDLHGLRLGPDGKIYFSIGDRGLHVVNKEGKLLDYPDTGSVLRCNPDGSELEVFAYGVRNPQCLAFDNYGNLFTGDNNCDHGDAARLVYVVEGGDSGWRTGYQVSETSSAGLWNSEKLWHLKFPDQSAYIVPPVAHIANGPAGFAHYPGTGFPSWLNDHFFLCDYKGASVNSGIHSFAVKPNGAGFKMVGHTNFIWGILASHVDFSPDGQMFIADWVAHWPKTDKGRLYRLYDPEMVKSPLVQETKKIIGEGMEKRPVAELTSLLSHPDQRIRLEAQFEMAERAIGGLGGDASVPDNSRKLIEALIDVARHNTNQLARIHALWGLGQIGRHGVSFSQFIEPTISLLKDQDAEVRAQTAKILGEAKVAKACTSLCSSLADNNSRVRFFAALSLGKLGNQQAVEPLLRMLRENADEDPYLRHAGVMGLVGAADKSALLAASRNGSPAVRLAVVLAMRREKLSDISVFLHDADPRIVLEAARAINDVPIPGAMPQLAALIDHPTSSKFLDWRVVNANFRIGGETNAAALVTYATQKRAPAMVRCEALRALETWGQPSERDRVAGFWRPLPPRDGAIAAKAMQRAMADLLGDSSDAVRISAIQAARKLLLTNSAPYLFKLAGDTNIPVSVRVEALVTLGEFHDAGLPEVVKIAVADADVEMRKEGSRLMAQIKPEDAVIALAAILNNGVLTEQQNALATLAKLDGVAVDKVIADWLEKLIAGKAAKEIQFDILEAAGKRSSALVKDKLKEYQIGQSEKDQFAGYRETLYGGNIASGRKIFTESPQAGCITCHTVKGDVTGGLVGPDLAGIIQRHDRDYLLESILYPNKQIAPGFENMVIKTRAGQIYAGVLTNEDGEELIINSPEEGTVRVIKVRKGDVESRQRGLSAMPEGLGSVLSKREIRDLIEYLANAKLK